MSQTLESISKISEAFVGIVKSLSLKRFLKWIVVVILIAMGALFIYEKYFSLNFYFSKLERKLEIAERVNRLNLQDSNIKKVAEQRVLEILQELSPSTTSVSLFQNMEYQDSNLGFSMKIFGALILPILVVFSIWKDHDRNYGIFGALVIVIISIAVGLCFPTFKNLWINFLILPIMQIILLLPFILKELKK